MNILYEYYSIMVTILWCTLQIFVILCLLAPTAALWSTGLWFGCILITGGAVGYEVDVNKGLYSYTSILVYAT